MKGLPEAIDRLISLEVRRDGVLDGVIDPLYRAAREVSGGPLAWEAASRLLDATSGGKTVYIATGHLHPSAMPAGETDGPPGAAALARAVVMSTDCPVVLLTEPALVSLVAATCRAVGLVVRPEDQLPLPHSVAVVPFPVDADQATTIARAIVPRTAAVVTVEKIGRSADGGYLTAYGTNVRDHLAKIDLLVDAAREAGVLTIGIGDLGNEIGMGLIGDAVAEYVPNGRSIASVVRTDCLIVAGCSNWGAYGVAASIAAMRRRVDLLHTPEIEREMILECCRAGAVDGLSAAPILAVDGLAWTTHAAVVQLLRDLVVVSTDDRPTERQRFE